MDLHKYIRRQQRRTFLGQAARGVGSLALASLLNPGLLRAAEAFGKPGPAKQPHWSGVVHPLHFPAIEGIAKRLGLDKGAHGVIDAHLMARSHTVELQTVPTGATVFVDGALAAGKTPLSFELTDGGAILFGTDERSRVRGGRT